PRCDVSTVFPYATRVRSLPGQRHVHRWRRKRASSPLVKAKPEIVAMGGDAVLASRCVLAGCDDCAGFRTVLRVRRRCGRGHVHRWRRKRALSPLVKAKPEIVAMGGDAVWALRCVMAVCDDYAGFRTVLRVRRRCGRGHVHRWRQKRGSSPLVKAKPEIRSEEHTSELQSRENLVCRLLLE